MMRAEAALAGIQTAPRRTGFARGFVHGLARKPLGTVGAVICVAFLFCGVFAGTLAPYGMNQISPPNRLQAPSVQHPLGTDHLGRDLLSRVLYGARVSVIIGFSAAGLSVLISVALGIVSGYFGGRTDAIVQRFVDAWMCFPALIVLIVFVAVVGTGTFQIVVLLGLVYGIGGSRIVRSAVLPIKEQLFVEAARSLGAGAGAILRRHILPNVLPPVIVLFTAQVGTVILTEASLSFLGLGVPPGTPSWGGMLADGKNVLLQAPHVSIFPGVCILLAVLGCNLLGDALADWLDPRLRE